MLRLRYWSKNIKVKNLLILYTLKRWHGICNLIIIHSAVYWFNSVPYSKETLFFYLCIIYLNDSPKKTFLREARRLCNNIIKLIKFERRDQLKFWDWHNKRFIIIQIGHFIIAVHFANFTIQICSRYITIQFSRC